MSLIPAFFVLQNDNIVDSPNGIVSYTINEAGRKYFVIEKTSGRISLRRKLDHESQKVFEVRQSQAYYNDREITLRMSILMTWTGVWTNNTFMIYCRLHSHFMDNWSCQFDDAIKYLLLQTIGNSCFVMRNYDVLYE